MSDRKRTTFPCPACHGKGSEFDRITDDGQGVTYECGLCGKGEGQLTIGGPGHQRYVLDVTLGNLLYRWDDTPMFGDDYNRYEAWAKEANTRAGAIYESVKEFWTWLADTREGEHGLHST